MMFEGNVRKRLKNGDLRRLRRRVTTGSDALGIWNLPSSGEGSPAVFVDSAAEKPSFSQGFAPKTL